MPVVSAEVVILAAGTAQVVVPVSDVLAAAAVPAVAGASGSGFGSSFGSNFGG